MQFSIRRSQCTLLLSLRQFSKLLPAQCLRRCESRSEERLSSMVCPTLLLLLGSSHFHTVCDLLNRPTYNIE